MTMKLREGKVMKILVEKCWIWGWATARLNWFILVFRPWGHEKAILRADKFSRAARSTTVRNPGIKVNHRSNNLDGSSRGTNVANQTHILSMTRHILFLLPHLFGTLWKNFIIKILTWTLNFYKNGSITTNYTKFVINNLQALHLFLI